MNQNKFLAKRAASRANRSKYLFTPGPASLTAENLYNLGPAFGRGDNEYLRIETAVLGWLSELSGQPKVARVQGSATLAIEVALQNFVTGNVLLMESGYYSDRIAGMLSHRPDIRLKILNRSSILDHNFKCDWVIACPTETSTAYLTPIIEIKELADKVGAQLFLDATGSIGLEIGHELGDVVCFSSCKGLFGLTGASFIAFKSTPTRYPSEFSLSLETYLEKKTTGPYHAIQSLYANICRHSDMQNSVKINKSRILKMVPEMLVHPIHNQPLLCTAVNAEITTTDSKVVLYQPRSDNPFSIACHIGEVHLGSRAKGNILNRISFIPLEVR